MRKTTHPHETRSFGRSSKTGRKGKRHGDGDAGVREGEGNVFTEIVAAAAGERLRPEPRCNNGYSHASSPDDSRRGQNGPYRHLRTSSSRTLRSPNPILPYRLLSTSPFVRPVADPGFARGGHIRREERETKRGWGGGVQGQSPYSRSGKLKAFCPFSYKKFP